MYLCEDCKQPNANGTLNNSILRKGKWRLLPPNLPGTNSHHFPPAHARNTTCFQLCWKTGQGRVPDGVWDMFGLKSPGISGETAVFHSHKRGIWFDDMSHHLIVLDTNWWRLISFDVGGFKQGLVSTFRSELPLVLVFLFDTPASLRQAFPQRGWCPLVWLDAYIPALSGVPAAPFCKDFKLSTQNAQTWGGDQKSSKIERSKNV